MNEKQIMEKELFEIARRFSMTRLKVSTFDFDREYRRDSLGEFILVSEKAVIRVLGKTTKVLIGEGHKFSTYDDAFESVKKYWQEYYRKARASRTDKERMAESKRQKLYHARKRAKELEIRQRM